MSLTITVPDKIARIAEAEAVAQGSSTEGVILRVLDNYFAEAEETLEQLDEDAYAPLMKMIGLSKGGRSDSSVRHDYRSDDPI